MWNRGMAEIKKFSDMWKKASSWFTTANQAISAAEVILSAFGIIEDEGYGAL